MTTSTPTPCCGGAGTVPIERMSGPPGEQPCMTCQPHTYPEDVMAPIPPHAASADAGQGTYISGSAG